MNLCSFGGTNDKFITKNGRYLLIYWLVEREERLERCRIYSYFLHVVFKKEDGFRYARVPLSKLVKIPSWFNSRLNDDR